MARRVEVGLQVGSLVKKFNVVGDRHWSKSAGSVSASQPEPFAVMPIGYDRAFGGIDRTTEETDGQVETFVANPAGRGFWRHTDEIDGKPLPNTEEIGRPVTQPDGDYRPMALSPIGRAWEPRWRYAGTYDQSWQENRAPFWPDDFDHRYFHAAAPDQIVPYLQGGEEVILENLSPTGTRQFLLPVQPKPITFIPHRGRDVTRHAVLDTVVFEPDENRFTTTWRCGLALGKSVFDVQEAIAGETSLAWRRAQQSMGKKYYANLAEVVAARRNGGKK
jgi:hypothetical protein